MKQVCNKLKIKMFAFVMRQRQIELNIGRTRSLIDVDSAKFGNETHFMSFTVIIAARNGTEGSYFQI
jgi:hypothetical protein